MMSIMEWALTVWILYGVIASVLFVWSAHGHSKLKHRHAELLKNATKVALEIKEHDTRTKQLEAHLKASREVVAEQASRLNGARIKITRLEELSEMRLTVINQQDEELEACSGEIDVRVRRGRMSGKWSWCIMHEAKIRAFATRATRFETAGEAAVHAKWVLQGRPQVVIEDAQADG